MKTIICLLIVASTLAAQEFVVEKKVGNVKVLVGTSENILKVKSGDKLNANDLVITEKNSTVTLKKGGSTFFLRSNSALSLDKIKSISTDDLLLSLAMEEIKGIRKKSNNGNSKNTAVYGAKLDNRKSIQIDNHDFGIKKLNGAKQLSKNGFKESAVLVAKETFRKFPTTQKDVDYRVYFAELMLELNLIEEALKDFEEMMNLNLNEEQKTKLQMRVQELKNKLSQLN